MYNFSAGPTQLPTAVLSKARDELLDWHGSGLSVMEMPFTSDEFKEIYQNTTEDLSDLICLPDNYHILLLQGGAYAHFSLLAMNLLGKNPQADYIQTGHWSARAITEAQRYGNVCIAASSKDNGYIAIPSLDKWKLNPNAAYCHITTNETANGVQFQQIPELNIPLVADMTSDFLTRQMDISKFGLVYASAQKNIGPTGLTIVIVRDDLINQAQSITPTAFNYGQQSKSRVNTPATYSIYIAGLMFSWLKEQGGIAKIAQQNQSKAEMLYNCIDNNALYQCKVEPDSRSQASICFDLESQSLVNIFINKAKENGLVNLKGHDSYGGIRVSNYNAMPVDGIETLIRFMQDFSTQYA